ncbi:EamA family transporter [Candidatus Woesearchaeota archaeon]|nr:EamA family transporter [Candidatus Woesearchaeota archaeon]
MNVGILFAIIAALSFGVWTVFHQYAAEHINYLFGAIIVSLTAVILGLVFLIPQIKTITIYSNPKGILFAALAGVCALAIDFFALKAYGSGLSISVGGPVIIGGSVAIAAVLGFFLGESITLLKIFGLALVIAGSGILSALS